MSSQELQKDNINKCTPNKTISQKDHSNICHEITTDLKMSQGLHSLSTNMSSLRNSKTKSLSFSFGSSISLDKFSFYDVSSGPFKCLSNEAITNICEDVDDELSDDDLIEIQSTPLNFKDNHYKNHNKKYFIKKTENQGKNLYCKDTIKDVKVLNTEQNMQDISFTANTPTLECGQSNIEECLLDLDNYLEQMDENCGLQNSNDLNTNKSITRTPKVIYSSIREKHSLGKKSQFERSSRLRNTISCTSDKQNVEHILKYDIDQHGREIAKNELFLNGNLDINKEVPQCSNYIDKSAYSENTNALRLRNESVNKMPLNDLGLLTDETIFQNIIEQQETCMQNSENNRPRQLGRRSERMQTLTTSLNNENPNCEYVNNTNPRPMSASAFTPISIPDACSHNVLLYGVSDGSTTRTSPNTSLVSIESSTDSGASTETPCNIVETNIAENEENNEQGAHPVDCRNMDTSIKSGFNSYWPHNYSRTLALISCTLGLFNISRFAILTINYGGNFLVQFLILSILFGIPFLWLQMSLGAKIEAGPITMWRISPICVGIGISLVFVQFVITIYSSVVVVWILVYIRDIFINHSSYPWSESNHSITLHQTSQIITNLTESIPEYFNANVLQRLYIFKISAGNGIRLHISDRVAFYLVILWTIVFLTLCKGLKSFGKIIFFVGVLPIVFLAAVAVKLLFIIDFTKLQDAFSSSEFDEFFVNSKTWSAAAQEAFLTWGILGTSIIAMSSRTHKKSSILTLRNDAILVVLVTVIGLCLSALIGICLIQVVTQKGYMYVPGSYENPAHYSSIFSLKSSPSSDLISYPTKLIPHYSTLIGEVYRRHTDIRTVSGYQVLRFVTELLPAVLSISTENFSWIWALIIYIMLLVFGISQLCVMWKPISCALGNSTSAVLLSCVTGLLLSIPFATEIGITLLHYMDILLGGAWFIPVLWVAEIFGIFLIRGRPYNGDDLVKDLKMSGSISAFLALSWNVLLPIGLITLAVIEYKISLSSQLYYWRGKSYFTYWSRKVGALTQIGFLLLVPISAIIQIYRYLSSGPPDILDRIQMLYRPLDEADNVQSSRNILNSRYHNQNRENSAFRHFQDDPPKYTPPPSYTTATGARLAKILRQSLRRSVRRILGESERSTLSIQHGTQNEQAFYPPEYPSVSSNRFVRGHALNATIRESIEVDNRPSLNSFYGRSLSLGRKQLLNKRPFKEANQRPLSARQNNFDFHSNITSSRTLRDRPYTAEDVITILRSSTLGRRRATEYPQTESMFRSIENLVQNAEPPNISSAVIKECLNQNDQSSSSAI